MILRRTLAFIEVLVILTLVLFINTSEEVSAVEPVTKHSVTYVPPNITNLPQEFITTVPKDEGKIEETKATEESTETTTESTESTKPTEKEETTEPTETVPLETEETFEVETKNEWQGEVLNSMNGTVEGPSGKETYYNLDMSGVISIMQNLGYNYEYSIREDGVKMYGPYIMCAADLDLRPRGTILETSLGTAIVCDTGGFAESDPYQIDIAVSW